MVNPPTTQVAAAVQAEDGSVAVTNNINEGEKNLDERVPIIMATVSHNSNDDLYGDWTVVKRQQKPLNLRATKISKDERGKTIIGNNERREKKNLPLKKICQDPMQKGNIPRPKITTHPKANKCPLNRTSW